MCYGLYIPGAIEDLSLSCDHRCLLAYIWRKQKNAGVCRLTNEQLATNLECSANKVATMLNFLEKHKYITRETRKAEKPAYKQEGDFTSDRGLSLHDSLTRML